jgi:hypothetical protein
VDSEKVVSEVRDVSIQRLRIALARKMKSADARDRLDNFGPARITVRMVGSVLQVSVDSSEAVSFLRLRVDQQALVGPGVSAFEEQLLASVQRQAGRFRYSADLKEPLQGRRLQVLVQTVTASIASTTTDLRDLN